MGDVYRLSFFLPRVLMLSVSPGRHRPCLAGCVLRVDPGGWVTIEGPSREQVFNQFRKWIRPHVRGHGPLDITMVLRSPRSEERERWTGRTGDQDSYTAIFGAEISIIAGARPAIDIGSSA